MKRWEASKLDRAHDTARTVEFWYRTKYNMPPTDPRYLATSYIQMADEFYATLSYNRMMRGDGDETEYDSGESEDEILAGLDELGAEPLPPAHDDWDDVTPADLLKELDQL